VGDPSSQDRSREHLERVVHLATQVDQLQLARLGQGGELVVLVLRPVVARVLLIRYQGLLYFMGAVAALLAALPAGRGAEGWRGILFLGSQGRTVLAAEVLEGVYLILGISIPSVLVGTAVRD